MDSQISYKLFSNQDNKVSNNIFFLHGNGFPPDSYSNFLNILSSKANIYAMNQKPFHPTNINPNLIYGWDIFKNDAIKFLKQNQLDNTIAVGHSMGAIVILLIEIENPGTFKNIFLLDPVITSKMKSILYKVLLKFNAIDKRHPMIRRTNSKKIVYDNFESIYNSYRSKNIFSKISDKNLKIYIESIIEKHDSKVRIRLSKDWENSIYRNGSLSDGFIWDNIHKIKTPTYIIIPQQNEFGHFNYGRQLKKKNSNFINLYINNATHLFPLERPNKTAELIISNIVD